MLVHTQLHNNQSMVFVS